MAGRNKQPLSVIQGKGRSNHITKKEAKKREEQEEAVRGYTDKIKAPSYLTKKQKEEFNQISEELVRLNIFSNLDVDGLARYIDSRDQYIKLTKDIRTMKATRKVEGHKLASDDYAKLTRVRNLLFNECKAAASELGLSITSRLKLVIPKKEDDAPKSEFDKKFGDV
ncbi:phage terminase small subunit P27 family [Radiobacillus kanasensis]|uniref:phage terminase small subunit P27 family n=1 Tax=Radiobacillus kanasensis TaxID=2844358 RepID=UPI001E60E515|nr:phage terminase small subunit P27 family [Radiobacillus kanasensis]UFT98102.1 phage terminase small subunit P27 family [Radiobacillus kanasensis]